jgi:MATE family, multidrug efflux pump
MNRQSRLERRVADARTMRALVALAAPIATAMGGETVMGLVDTKLVGGLGPAALGGVGVAMTIVFFGYMTIFGLMRGVKVCVAHAVGQGHGARSVRYAQAGVTLGLLAGGAVWASTRDVGPLLRAIGIEAALVPYARTFLATFTFGAPASAVLSALTHHRQAIGDARTPMIVGLSGNVLNALLGWSLIYGHAGLPALGVRGGAMATAATEYVEALVLAAALLWRTRRERSYRRVRSELSLRSAIREVAELGIPTGLQFGSEMLAFVTFTALLGTLGAAQIAAHQIALATIRTSFLPGTAVAEAASVLVGQALGRRSLVEADRTTRAALLLAVGFMATCGVAFAIGGSAIVRAFTDDAGVGRVARRLLWIASGFQVLDAVAIVLRGALRGARDVRVPALIGVAVIWTCVPTAALVLGRVAGWGAAGGWFGFVAETTIGAILFGARWRHGSWRHAYAEDRVGAREARPALASELTVRGES